MQVDSLVAGRSSGAVWPERALVTRDGLSGDATRSLGLAWRGMWSDGPPLLWVQSKSGTPRTRSSSFGRQAMGRGRVAVAQKRAER